MKDEYETMHKLLAVYPQFFPDSDTWFTYDNFKWALSFVH
jgi:hypothetical protein